jgi:hypothetical protein
MTKLEGKSVDGNLLPGSGVPPVAEDRLANAKAQGQAQFDSIVEMIEALNAAQSEDQSDDYSDSYEDAENAIHADALSVEVRSDWYLPYNSDADTKPAEYRILLCTGGPAVQIRGTLSEHGEPETAYMEVQDWFTPWTEFRPLAGKWKTMSGVELDSYDSEPVLLAYARCFFFGE